MKEIIKCKTITTTTDEEVSIDLIKNNKVYSVELDEVEWFTNNNLVHATILFELLCKHINEYMRFIESDRIF